MKFNDFRLEYEDTQTGIFSRLNLGSFILNPGEIDLHTNFFHVKNLSFENSEIVLKMKEESSTSKIDVRRNLPKTLPEPSMIEIQAYFGFLLLETQ